MTEDASSKPPSTIDVHYLKSEGFREVACDGVMGGPTPHGKLWLSFYSERFPLPRVVRQEVRPVEGDRFETSGPGSVLESRSGMIRNVEFGVYMSVETATQLRDWLTKQIELFQGREQ